MPKKSKKTNSNSIGQFGEYIVASELCRRGFIATTFSRNMPYFDILIFNKTKGKERTVQVKTIKSQGDWQFNARTFLKFDAKLFKRGVQKIVGITNRHQAGYFIRPAD